MPDDGKTIILLDNTSSGKIREIGNGLKSILYGSTPPDPKQPVSDVMHDWIESDGLESAIKQYRKILQDDSEMYDISESELNMLGYYYLNHNRTELAIEVFKLNTVAYPDSPNTFDSLGEAYMKAEMNALALEQYQKVLDLNPNHSNAKRMIEILNSN